MSRLAPGVTVGYTNVITSYTEMDGLSDCCSF